MHTQSTIASFAGHNQGFCCLHWKCELKWCCPPLTMQVASMPLGLVSTQVSLISCSTRSSKLPFIQKAAAIVTIVWGTAGGAYGRDKIIIRAIAPSPLLAQSSVQKVGAYFGKLMTLGLYFRGDVPLVLMCTVRTPLQPLHVMMCWNKSTLVRVHYDHCLWTLSLL